jgi:hypothetical protein
VGSGGEPGDLALQPSVATVSLDSFPILLKLGDLIVKMKKVVYNHYFLCPVNLEQ